MALDNRSARAGRASSGNFVSKAFGLAVTALIAVTAMTTGASGPHFQSVAVSFQQLEVASISYSSVDPVITGSVDHMFQTSSFVGPNRSSKTDRARPQVDLMAMATSFNQMRIHLASLEAEPFDPAAPQSHVTMPNSGLITGSDDDAPALDEGPRISIASIDPAAASQALDAIEEVTPLDPSIPLPVAVPEQLAYARANTPTTEHEVNHFSTRERWCLATAIYFEARGETYRGQVAVAQVIMNRVDHRLYPNTICGVVFQNQTWRNRCQFSFACDGIPERINEPEPWEQAESIADQVSGGTLYLAEVADSTHYHANYVYPHWAPRMTRVSRIGAHIFYKFRSG